MPTSRAILQLVIERIIVHDEQPGDPPCHPAAQPTAGPRGSAAEPNGRLRSDRVDVASAGDGTLRRYAGADFASLGVTNLGDDADNVRLDAKTGQVVVGYGDGALALVDAASGKKNGDIVLAAHPELFRIEADGRRIFVNVPKAHEVAVVDRDAGKQVASWKVDGRENFPMALDEAGGRLLIVDRNPPELLVFDTGSGERVARLATCGDADDVFWDAKRQRVYVSCGEGFLDVVQRQGTPTGTWSGSRRPPAPAPPCSCPNSTACSWPCGRAIVRKRRSGFFDRHHSPVWGVIAPWVASGFTAGLAEAVGIPSGSPGIDRPRALCC